MRPLLLTMKAFGPYRDSETIDFRELGQHRLFVISGNTGAGKTTIFDAICYALYGSASGEDRSEPRMLRSHFAREDQHTSVDFTFQTGSRVFRVFRQMAHRKGGNKSETGSKIELYELISGEEAPAVDRFAVQEVSGRIEQLLGLNKEQFSQIVMLPQGEFRKLLTSDTENKEDILRRLFRTGLYRKLEEVFYLQTRELREQLKEGMLRLHVYAKQAGELLPERAGSELAATLAQEHQSPQQLLEGLRQELRHYEGQLQAGRQRQRQLAAQVAEQESELRAAAALNERFAEQARKQAQQQSLLQRQPEMAALQRRAADAERAARLAPYEEQAQRLEQQLALRLSELEQARRRLADAEQAEQAAREQYSREQAREPQRRQAAVEQARLAEWEPAVATLAARSGELERLQATERAASAKLAAQQEQLAALKQQRRERQERLAVQERETAALPERLVELEQARARYKLLKELLELDKRYEVYREQAALQERQLAAAQAEHDRLERSWLEGQAGLLAAHLHDGQPCPVCGSEQHPHKAEQAGQLPPREQLEQAKALLGRAMSELSQAAAEAAAAQAGRASRDAELAALGLTQRPDEAALAQAEAEGRRLRAETDRLRQLAAALGAQREELQQLERELERQGELRERQAEAQREAAAQAERLEAQLAQELARIPAELATPERLAAARRELAAREAQLAAAWEAAQRELEQALSQSAKARAVGEQLASQLRELETAAREAAQRLADELRKAGFERREQYAAARLPEAELSGLQAELKHYAEAVAFVAQQVAELQSELAGKEQPELSGLEQQLAQLKEQQEAEAAGLARTEQLMQAAQRLSEAIAETAAGTAELERRLEQALDIYQMLKGDNALKISFERYILIEFLEQILLAANERLQELTGGQFSLQRSERLEVRGKQSGLGLDVYDAYTGQNRDVKTLSGGEKFNASLCLALGMTDVIQSHQGGISIEMMFIDEGFGSLDEESLHKAIQTLVGLQQAGRMIGIISHVPELKQASPAVLEITKTREGYSRATMKLKC